MHFVRVTGQRTALAVIALFAVSLITFWAVELLPGDAATRMLGREATPERVAHFQEQMNLDAPALERYTTWITGFVQGDWGESLVQARPPTEGAPAGRINRSVTDIIVPRLTNTLQLAALALIMYIPLSLTVGIVTAVYRTNALVTWGLDRSGCLRTPTTLISSAAHRRAMAEPRVPSPITHAVEPDSRPWRCRCSQLRAGMAPRYSGRRRATDSIMATQCSATPSE